MTPTYRWILAWSLMGFACSTPEQTGAGPEPGDPLPDLSEEELGRFLLGKAVFERLTTPEEGLGPLFNEPRCSSCHNVPETGGSGRPLVVKATRFVDNSCNLLTDVGGDNIQRQTTPLLAAHGVLEEAIPEDATSSVLVTGPSLFGLGLVEAIPDDVILANADPDDTDGDGISGLAVRTADGRLGRFGRKAEIATVFDFTETALRFELGLTTPMNPMEETVNGVPIPEGTDPMVEPEIDERGMHILTDFVRFLAPPSRASLSRAARDSVENGERIFGEIGCASCHVPTMTTGASDVAALDGVPVHLYSDMLVHDMGAGLADVCGADVGPSEYRTARLWGLRFRHLLMHDGGAGTPLESIAYHGGEAARARTAFTELSPEEQAFVLAFLSSL